MPVSEKKDYRINFQKSPYNPDYFLCKLTFKRDDKVSLREIVTALSKTNQDKLNKAFEKDGVQVFVNRGYILGSISKATYENGLKVCKIKLAKDV